MKDNSEGAVCMLLALLLVWMLGLGAFVLVQGITMVAIESWFYVTGLPLGPGWWLLVMVEVALTATLWWLVRWRRSLPGALAVEKA